MFCAMNMGVKNAVVFKLPYSSFNFFDMCYKIADILPPTRCKFKVINGKYKFIF